MTSPIASNIITWQKAHGRHKLPWQKSDPYSTWISEVMLQQTQVEKVIPYYQRFMQRFPDVAHLAAASINDVLSLWSGLGYYRRAHNLHKAACMWHALYPHTHPQTRAEWIALPGIGRSTAGAILSLALHKKEAICDANVLKVFSRHFGMDLKGLPDIQKWQFVESLLPEKDIQYYNQGLMDIGATVCHKTHPACGHCPLAETCVYNNTSMPINVKPTKNTIAKQNITFHVGLCLEDNSFALKQRVNTGIWPQLYFLPEILNTKPADYYFKHILTHRLLHVYVYLIAKEEIEEDVLWITYSDLARHAHPSLLQKILTKHFSIEHP